MRSQIAHGVIESIDVTEALAMPGVHAVVTAADIEGDDSDHPVPAAQSDDRALRAAGARRGMVRYVGEPVAMVLADCAERAEDAVQAVVLDIEPLPVSRRPPSTRDGRQVAAVRRAPGANPPSIFNADKGDVDAAFRKAAYTRSASSSACSG